MRLFRRQNQEHIGRPIRDIVQALEKASEFATTFRRYERSEGFWLQVKACNRLLDGAAKSKKQLSSIELAQASQRIQNLASQICQTLDRLGDADRRVALDDFIVFALSASNAGIDIDLTIWQKALRDETPHRQADFSQLQTLIAQNTQRTIKRQVSAEDLPTFEDCLAVRLAQWYRRHLHSYENEVSSPNFVGIGLRANQLDTALVPPHLTSVLPKDETVYVCHFEPFGLSNLRQNALASFIQFDVLNALLRDVEAFLDWYDSKQSDPKKSTLPHVLIGATNERFAGFLTQLGFAYQRKRSKDGWRYLVSAHIDEVRKVISREDHPVLSRLRRRARSIHQTPRT